MKFNFAKRRFGRVMTDLGLLRIQATKMFDQFATVFLLIFYLSVLTHAFNINSAVKNSIPKQRTLAMKGKAPYERGLSKRSVFLKFKAAWNAATLIPGFLDEHEKPLEMELYCPSTRDGKQIGNCPYTQFLQMVMQKKGIQYKVIPTLPARRPDWILEQHEGKLPVVANKITDETLSDPLAIAHYIEDLYPHASLTQNGTITYPEVLEKTANFYPTLTKYILNKDEKLDESYWQEMCVQLELVDEILRSTPGRYLCGLQMNLADLYLTPLLWNAQVSVDMFKKMEILNLGTDPVRPALEKYMTDMFSLKEFNDKRTYVHIDKITYGWKVLRGEAPPPME